jgi:hypothetical protein
MVIDDDFHIVLTLNLKSVTTELDIFRVLGHDVAHEDTLKPPVLKKLLKSSSRDIIIT